MGITKTLGGDRLGAGKKMTARLDGYGRSSHNVGKIITTDQAAGTLVPYYCDIGLNGDTFYIDMETSVRTLPSVGPIFGSFKHQLDWFVIPIRLYIAALHNNALGIGLKMDKIYLPLLKWLIKTNNVKPNNWGISQDSLFAYVGIRGLGQTKTNTATTIRKNALFILAYWDIYKNYYANKQEEIGYFISPGQGKVLSMVVRNSDGETLASYVKGSNEWDTTANVTGNELIITFGEILTEDEVRQTKINLNNVGDSDPTNWTDLATWTLTPQQPEKSDRWIATTATAEVGVNNVYEVIPEYTKGSIALTKFNLADIDTMREVILKFDPSNPLALDENGTKIEPYNTILKTETKENGEIVPYASYSQVGLGIKTYLSDRFNNWLSTEWIDGEGGINDITAVDVSDGKLTMDALILQKKVFDLLNRIAISGGSYNDWQEAVFGMKTVRMAESPIYCGGMSSEIAFDEVVSNAASGDEPLGTLAGRGIQRYKKGGNGIKIKITEPSMIMCIGSITPRICYSQGNKWWDKLRTMNDFHKPELDAIGFQELTTDEFAAFNTVTDSNGKITYTSVGKQPSWIEYMTNVNESYGSFSADEALEWMVLNRKYSMAGDGSVLDATTYIDPTMYNVAFADTTLEAKNFWVNVAFDITARRVMSAKQIPNL